MKSRYRNYRSFGGKTLVSLCLLSIIPYLMVIYLFVHDKIDMTDTVALFSPIGLMFVLAGFSLLRRSADKLAELAEETGEIKGVRESKPIEIDADQEIEEIANNFNAVAKNLMEFNGRLREQSVELMAYARDLSLSYKRTKEEEKLRNELSRYLRKDLVEKIARLKGGMLLENERKVVSVLFADIRSFSRIAERMAAERVVSMLNAFFSAMVDIVFRNNGILDKFVGDQIMATFGLIPPNNSGASSAIKAAIEMQDAIEELKRVRSRKGLPTFEIGIGINTGSAIVGNVGSQNRMDYTVIGDSVNVAGRLQEISRGGEIIIGEKTYRRAQGQFRIQKKGRLRLKSKTEPVICYEVLRNGGEYIGKKTNL